MHWICFPISNATGLVGARGPGRVEFEIFLDCDQKGWTWDSLNNVNVVNDHKSVINVSRLRAKPSIERLSTFSQKNT